MTLATILLALALAAAAAFLLARLHPRLAPLAPFLLRAHAALALSTLLVVLLAFAAGDLGMRYVWAHVDVSYPLHYRVAGLWGGEEGTALLWGALVALAALLVARREGVLHARAAVGLVAFSGALALLNLVQGAFEATPADRLALMPQGRGLADVLLTPLMVIHPPLQFVAYALAAPVGAYAFAHWSLPDGREDARRWSAAAYPWARVAWLFATVGLGLGALWAYYVLSFGGYWAWDPVETSNLLPWLALTGFLHAGKQHLRFGDHALAAPLLAAGGFLLTVFATFATRSGLWVSVHAFTDPTSRFEPDAPARLLAIMDAHAPTRFFVGLVLGVLLLGVALFVRHRFGDAPAARWGLGALLLAAGAALADPAFVLGLAFDAGARAGSAPLGAGALLLLVAGGPFVLAYLRQPDARGAPRGALDPRRLMTAAVALLSVSLAVAFLLNLLVVNGPDRRVFDQRAPFLALPLASVLTVMLARAPLGPRRALALALAGAAAGVAAMLALPDARLLALATPILGAAALAACLKLAHVQGKAAPPALRVAGVLLLLAGVLGLLTWSNPPSQAGPVGISDAWSVPAAALGLSLSVLALVGAIAAFRARHPALAFAGALAGTLAAGLGVGAVLGLAALVLLLARRRALAPGGAFLRRDGARLRETGVYLVHLALVLGLVGYAASTYAAEGATFAATPLGSDLALGDHHLHVAEGALVQADAQGRLARVDVPLSLHDGSVMRASFAWSGAPSHHYSGELQVRRTLAEDVYVTPLAFKLRDGPWISADGPTMPQPLAGEVEAVSVRVSVLPLMGFVWGGLSGMAAGMGFILAGTWGAARPSRSAAAHEASRDEASDDGITS